MEKTDSLLRTKLHKPVSSQKLVLRARLQTRVAESFRKNPLTLVVAPARFGKATLLAASLVNIQEKVAWLSIDREDTQVSRFLAYLIAALQGADNRVCAEAAQIIGGMHQAVTEVILTSLINDLDSFGQEIVLVLDDFQNISDQEVFSAVAFLLEHGPRSFHLLLATRADPHLGLSRLRGRGQMVELRAADLRFAQDEALQFLNDVMGFHLEERAVKILEERTEGWIAGLQMAALSMHDRDDIQGFIAGFSGMNRHILDFLLEEIMAGQSSEIQHFLLCTSILDRLTAPLCDALLSDDDPLSPEPKDGGPQSEVSLYNPSASALKYLEQENLFLVALDEARIWFRYHHLFTDLLRARLHQTQPRAIPHLHIRAAMWLENNGYFTEAIQHLLLAQKYEEAADMIERYGPLRLDQSDPSVMMMANKLPQEILITRPKIGLYQAWFLIVRGNIKLAIPLLVNLDRRLAESGNPDEQRWMQTIKTAALAFLSPPSDDPNNYPLPDESLLDEIPAEEMILRNAADFLYGMALARKGKPGHALEFSIKCIEKEKSGDQKCTIPTLAPFVTRMYLITGQLNKCALMCHEYLDPIKESGLRFVYTSSSMKIDLGEVMCEWNCLEEAELYIREGLKGNEPWQNIMTDGFGLVALARVQQARGDYSGAQETAEMLEANLKSRALPRDFEEDFHTLRIRVQLSSGNLQACSMWAEQIQQSMDFILHKERYRLTLAQIYLAQGKFEIVEKLISGMTPPFSAGSQTCRQIEFNLLLAAALDGEKRHPEALALLESSLSLAEPEGYIRVFIEGGRPVQQLLTRYVQSGSRVHKAFTQKLLNAFTPLPANTPKPSTGGLIEPLSSRELEGLQLVAQGQTNEKIARHLVVARGTIKAHAASIYRKLDVNNRTEAVTRARQLGIIS